MAEPIEIIIRQGGQGGAGLGSGTGGNSSFNKKERVTAFGTESNILNNPIVKKAEKSAVTFMLSFMKKSIDYSLSNYGNMTGDYIGQREINDTLSVIGDFMSVGASGIGTFMVTGNAGLSVIAVAVSAGQKIGNIANQYRNYQLSITKQNIQADFMRERAYGTLGSGSRGTNE